MSIDEKRKIAAPDPDIVGGHTVLNFINTLRADAGSPLETLHNDRDVRLWAKKMNLNLPVRTGSLPHGALLESARKLRGLALSAVAQKAAGKPVALGGLNAYLSRAVSHLKLARMKEGAIDVRREYSAHSEEEILAPMAEAIAEFLATADFSRVHQCEGSGCVLWFQDRPNGRPRRFCTEETCGTRTRVAAHRARRRSMLEFFRDSPLLGSGIDLRRRPSKPRKVDL